MHTDLSSCIKSTPIPEGGFCILFIMTGIKYCKISLMALKLTFMNLKHDLNTIFHFLLSKKKIILIKNVIYLQAHMYIFYR